jgi:hypothetical protein
MGIEPTSSAWEAEVLPLNYTRDAITLKGITDACPRTDSIDQVINAQQSMTNKLFRHEPSS